MKLKFADRAIELDSHRNSIEVFGTTGSGLTTVCRDALEGLLAGSRLSDISITVINRTPLDGLTDLVSANSNIIPAVIHAESEERFHDVVEKIKRRAVGETWIADLFIFYGMGCPEELESLIETSRGHGVYFVFVNPNPSEPRIASPIDYRLETHWSVESGHSVTDLSNS